MAFKSLRSGGGSGTRVVPGESSPGGDFALVKWLSGKEKGKFTHNVQISWILLFDPEADFRSESHIVEWRVPPRPKAGWPVADAQVLEVSSKYCVYVVLVKCHLWFQFYQNFPFSQCTGYPIIICLIFISLHNIFALNKFSCILALSS